LIALLPASISAPNFKRFKKNVQTNLVSNHLHIIAKPNIEQSINVVLLEKKKLDPNSDMNVVSTQFDCLISGKMVTTMVPSMVTSRTSA
jgi:hypothetical protein